LSDIGSRIAQLFFKINSVKVVYKLSGLFLVMFSIAAASFWFSLPDPLFADPNSKIMLSSEGELLGAKIAKDQQWRFPGKGGVSEKYGKAVITFEDKRFMKHYGVDPVALFRSVWLNISKGRIVSGASTITMQVIRLSRKQKRRSFYEKIVEMIKAFRMEMSYTKDEILSLYAFNAPFGGNIVGLETASWRYFGRSSANLSWAESALLAVLPNSPALIHPGRNRSRLKSKRDKLLEVLRERGEMTALDCELAIKEPLPEKPLPLPRVAPHLLETVIMRNRKGENRSFFRTTLKKNVQLRTSTVIGRHTKELEKRGVYNAAAVVIDNRSFKVIAYVGNTTHKFPAHEVDIIRRPRSTGSILKPLLYAGMLEKGETVPSAVIPDIPLRFRNYTPSNFNRKFMGVVPAKIALARSLNIPAVVMLRKFGLHRFYDFLKESGVSTLHRAADKYGLTLILGGAEGTLWDLASVYSNLARIAAGMPAYQAPGLLDDELPKKRKIDLGRGSAWLTAEALLEVERPGRDGYWKNFSSSRKVAWKTGTSFGLRDAWAIGVTPEYTVAVWAGNARGDGRPGLTGISVAAPILFDIFGALESTSWFEKPKSELKEVEVCSLSGFLASENCETKLESIPLNSKFDKQCPYHRLVHLSKDRNYRVNGKCESVNNMVHESWFVLPPLKEYYYRKIHPEYRPLPPMGRECDSVISEKSGRLRLIYPGRGTKIFIPIKLDGHKSEAVFKAIHKDPGVTLFWHLDDKYIGHTKIFHQLSVSPPVGKHNLTIVAKDGERVEREFTVIGR